MATLPEEQIAPVAAVNPVATAAPQPTLAPITASQVYDPTNIQQINIPSNKRAMDMKLSTLEKKLSKANSIADLNQIGIMNQPKAMGVLTGEAAYRDKLDTARVNAFNSLYNNRKEEEKRKEAERQNFISTYGADPKMRPSGMSKREFQKALAGGQFSNLLTEDFKQKQLETASKRKSLAGGGGAGSISSANIVSASSALQGAKGEDNYTNPYEYIKQRDLFVANTPGSTYDDFDSKFAGMLNPRDYGSVGFTPAQQSALSGITPAAAAKTAEEEKQKQARLVEANNTVSKVDELVKSPGLNNAVGSSAFKWVTRMGTPFSKEKEAFIGQTQNILDQVTMEKLIEVKGQGATFGALSDSEREMIQRAASPIWQWVVKDKNGKIVGYDIDEKTFKKELERLKETAQQSIDKANGGIGANVGEIVEKNGIKYKKVEGGWIQIN